MVLAGPWTRRPCPRRSGWSSEVSSLPPSETVIFQGRVSMGSVVFGVFHFLLRTAARQKLCVVSVREGKLPARAGRAAQSRCARLLERGLSVFGFTSSTSPWLLLFAVVPKGPVIFLQLTVSWFILQFCCPIFHLFLVVVTSNAVLGSSARGF